MTNEDYKKLKVDVKDLLNQLILKLKDVKDTIPTCENENYQEVYDVNDPSYNRDQAFLISVKNYSQRVVSNEYDAIYNEEQFYNSNCY